MPEEAVDPTAWPSSYYGRTRHVDLAKFYHDIQDQLRNEPPPRRVSFSVEPPKVHRYNQGDLTAVWLDQMMDDWGRGRRKSAPASLATRGLEEDDDDNEEEEDLWGWDSPTSSADHHYIQKRSDGLHHIDLRPIPNRDYRPHSRPRSTPPSLSSSCSSRPPSHLIYEDDDDSDIYWLEDNDSSTFGEEEDHARMCRSYEPVNVVGIAKKQFAKTYVFRTWTRIRKSSLGTMSKRLSLKRR
ncbi:hypothetical protein DFQ28_010130 [Apophysomyces sp. BC1034]|nr:hypothetical protein DFQ30_002670 [Apophysomyces sp. BC1015]KAG0179726.1 hypothetical protein DFQ29_001735 [Apophysomyces sp. BC1021]KAG0185000.1 hypothetical protein DFQ28_010130 [Apophysomyces sp. BC1034]